MPEILTEEEAAERVADLEGWRVEDGHLWCTRTFEDFEASIAFVNRVAEIAEDYEHHPDIHVHWDTVDLEVWTHEEDALTEWDVELAALVDKAT